MERLLRALSDVFAFDENPLCMLRINLRPARRELVLADGATVRPDDTVVNLFTWPERVPPYAHGETSAGLSWQREYTLRLSFTLHRLWRYLHNHPEWSRAIALTGLFVFPEGRYAELGTAALVRLGFHSDSLVMSPHGVDATLGRSPSHRAGVYEQYLVRALLRSSSRWSTAGRAVVERYWVSRARLDAAHAQTAAALPDDEPFYWERYAPRDDPQPQPPRVI